MQAGLTALKVASAVGKATGVPLPDLSELLSDALGPMMDVIEEVRGDVEAALGTGTSTVLERIFSGAADRAKAEASALRGGLEEQGSDSREQVSETRGLVKKSANVLADLLTKEYPDWADRTGLEKVPSVPWCGSRRRPCPCKLLLTPSSGDGDWWCFRR